jgi:pimeloyl-ACP methyl ester carboxylesterase
MDGTGELFAPFVAAAPAQFEPIVVALPDVANYSALDAAIGRFVPQEGPLLIVAESFSGPLGVHLATTLGKRVRALILCNSFVVSPRPSFLRFLAWPALFAFPTPGIAIRLLLLGLSASPDLVESVKSATRKTSARIMASRLREVLTLDRLEQLRKVSCPVLYLRGTQDRLVTSASGEQVLRAVPHAKRVELPGPHLLLQAMPARSWEAISAFMADVAN